MLQGDGAALEQVLEAAGGGDDDVGLGGLARLGRMPTPPKTGATLSARDWAIERSSSTICSASSRVGARIERRGAARLGLIRSTIGTPKASVLPDPVGDWTSTSSPARMSAMRASERRMVR